jgi:folate-binding protein YgfZ
MPESTGTGLDLLRSGAALVTHPDRAVVRVAGAERASWLQGLLTNDVEALTPGRGCYAAWLTPQGRMITDAVVLAEDDTVTVEVPAAVGDAVRRQLDAAIFAEDVQLADEAAAWAWVGVHGAAAAAVVERALAGRDLDATRLAEWAEYTHAAAGPTGRVMRLDTYGGPGFVLRVPRADVDLWRSRLRLAGAVLVAAADLEFARIEAGRPEFLVDMDADTIPLEAGIESRAISFTKGCYVGQEVIVRILHRGGGRVARHLVGLVVAGDVVPTARATVAAARGDVGRVTSAAWSPRLSCPVALAYVHRDSAVAGTAVTVRSGSDEVAAVVHVLPMA